MNNTKWVNGYVVSAMKEGHKAHFVFTEKTANVLKSFFENEGVKCFVSKASINKCNYHNGWYQDILKNDVTNGE